MEFSLDTTNITLKDEEILNVLQVCFNLDQRYEIEFVNPKKLQLKNDSKCIENTHVDEKLHDKVESNDIVESLFPIMISDDGRINPSDAESKNMENNHSMLKDELVIIEDSFVDEDMISVLWPQIKNNYLIKPHDHLKSIHSQSISPSSSSSMSSSNLSITSSSSQPSAPSSYQQTNHTSYSMVDQDETIALCPQIRDVLGRPVTLSEFEQGVQPLDIILMQTETIVGRNIRRAQNFTRKGCSLFSHVGMLVNREICGPSVPIKDDRMHVMESVVAGIIPAYDSILNVHGFPYCGVQVRSLYSQLHAPENVKTKLFWAPLRPEMRQFIMKNNSITQIQQILKSFMWMKYPVLQPLNVLHAINPIFNVFKKYRKEGYVICSELVAAIFCKLGVLHDGFDSTTIFPADFVIQPELKSLFAHISLITVNLQ